MFTRQTPAQDARDAANNARRESALAALFPHVKTWADAKRECAALGFTCRPDPAGAFADGSRGYETFPKGDGRSACYATTPADAVFVARAHALDLSQNRLGFGGASIAAVIETLFRAALRVTVGEWADLIQIDFTVYGAGSAPSARVVLTCDSIRNPISGYPVRAEVTEFCRRDTALALAAMEAAQDFAARVQDAGGFPVAEPQDAPAPLDCLCLTCGADFDSLGGLVQICPACYPDGRRDALAQEAQDAARAAAAQAPDARALRPETAAELAALCAPLSARTGRRADVLAPLAVGAARVALWLARGAEPSDILAALFPPCPTEDSALCHWRADVSGNGAGVSFIALSESFALYRAAD